MDVNKINSISKITNNLHDEIDAIYEGLMDEDFKETSQAIDTVIESLKHLKTNLKEDEI